MRWYTLLLVLFFTAPVSAQEIPAILLCVGSTADPRIVASAYTPLAERWTPKPITPAAALQADLAAIVDDRVKAHQVQQRGEAAALRERMTPEEKQQLDTLLDRVRQRQP